MEKNEFKAGDVVKLKSGGSKLTVYAIDGETVSVLYFNEKGDMELKTRIPYQALIKSDS